MSDRLTEADPSLVTIRRGELIGPALDYASWGQAPERAVSYFEATAAVQASVDRLEAVDRLRIYRLFRRYRDQVRDTIVRAGEIGGISDFQAFHLQQVMSGIDNATASFAAQYGDEQAAALMRMWGHGTQGTAWALQRSGINAPAVFGLDRRSLEAALNYSARLVTHVTQDTRRQVDNLLFTSFMGSESNFDIIAALDRLLDPTPHMGTTDPRQFRTGPGYARAPYQQAETVLRTEKHRVLSMSQRATIETMADRGLEMQKMWLHGGGGREPRPYHQDVLDGQIIPYDQDFNVNGFAAWGPHDPRLPAREAINCYLPGTMVEGDARVALRSRYAGPAREIKTRGGHRLRVTPNHPVLTPHGLVPARLLREGDQVLARRVDVERGVLGDVDDQHGPVAVEDVFEALAANGRVRAAMVAGLDFHGEASVGEDEIDVVLADSVLAHDIQAALAKLGDHESLVTALTALPAMAGERAAAERLLARLAATDGGVSEARLARLLLVAEAGNVQARRFGDPAPLDAGLVQQSRQGGPADALLAGEGGDAGSGMVAVDDIIEVREFEFSGHVYDLQCVGGLMIAAGIVCSNCTCRVVPWHPSWSASRRFDRDLDEARAIQSQLQAEWLEFYRPEEL